MPSGEEDASAFPTLGFLIDGGVSTETSREPCAPACAVRNGHMIVIRRRTLSYDASLVHSGFAVQVNREGGDDHECNEYSS
jgi:hypothetical protein